MGKNLSSQEGSLLGEPGLGFQRTEMPGQMGLVLPSSSLGQFCSFWEGGLLGCLGF